MTAAAPGGLPAGFDVNGRFQQSPGACPVS